MGPNVEILLPSHLADEQRDRIGEILAGVSDRVDGRDFWVTDTRALGGEYTGPGLPFSLVDEEETDLADYGATEFELINSSLGFSPQSMLGLVAYVNSESTHRVLGELALCFAQTLSGLIDFGGALLPVGSEASSDRALEEEMEPLLVRMTADARGQLLAIPYTTAAGRKWACTSATSPSWSGGWPTPHFVWSSSAGANPKGPAQIDARALRGPKLGEAAGRTANG